MHSWDAIYVDRPEYDEDTQRVRIARTLLRRPDGALSQESIASDSTRSVALK